VAIGILFCGCLCVARAVIDRIANLLSLLRAAHDVQRRTQYKHFDLLIDAAGIRRHRRKGFGKFHALRRSTATLMAAAAGVGAASTLLGHTDTYVTRRYVDPSAVTLDATTVLPSLAAG
jgi:integrase